MNARPKGRSRIARLISLLDAGLFLERPTELGEEVVEISPGVSRKRESAVFAAHDVLSDA